MIRKIGIIANTTKPGIEKAVGDFLELADEKGLQCLLDDELQGICAGSRNFCPKQQLVSQSDIIVAFGGDGTILSAARAVGSAGIPILGVNLGRLGFLTGVGPTRLRGEFGRLLTGDYQLDKRMVLEASWGGNTFFALNEIVIEKGASPRVIEIELSAGDQLVNGYIADGLIISTPTGSTAHSLSAGGPIAHPKTRALIVTPICPHSLSVRPLIFSDDTVLTVKVRSDHPRMVLTADGQTGCNLDSGDRVIIKKAPHTINLVDFQDRSFYDVLRARLNWGNPRKKE